MNIPKTRRTLCQGCKKHVVHKVTQYKTGKASLFAQGTFDPPSWTALLIYCDFIGKRRYDRKQSGFGGQTKPIFRKKVHTRTVLPSGFTYELVSFSSLIGQDYQEDRPPFGMFRMQAQAPACHQALQALRAWRWEEEQGTEIRRCIRNDA